jgi:hypothetical protein
MSFWDNVKKFTQPYADDEYDDYDDEDSTVGYEEEEETAPRFGRRAADTTADSTGFDFVTEIVAFAARLPFHLIACWAFRRSDNICVPILTLASVNLLSSVVLFIMTLFV